MMSCKMFSNARTRPVRCVGASRRPVVRTRAIAEPPAEFEAVNHQAKTFKVDLEALKLDEETAKDLYRDMRLGRDFEDMCAQMYYRGKMFGFVHLYCGQEAVSTGVIRLLGKKDYVCRCECTSQQPNRRPQILHIASELSRAQRALQGRQTVQARPGSVLHRTCVNCKRQCERFWFAAHSVCHSH